MTTHLGDRITPLVDGQLPPDATERAHAHLASCDTCREAVETERLLKSRLASLGSPQPGDELMARLLGMAGPEGPLPPRAGHVPGTPRPRTLVAPGRPVRTLTRPAGRPVTTVRPAPGPRRVPARISRARATAAMVGALCLVGAGVAGGVASNAAPSMGPSVTPPVDTFVVEHTLTSSTLPFGDQTAGWGIGGNRPVNRPRTFAGSALPFVLVIGLVVLVPAPANAATAPAPAGAADEARAVALLRRAVQAAASLAYTGTQVVTAWPAAGGADTRLLEIRQQAGGARQVITRDPAGSGDSSASSAVASGGRASAALDALAAAYRLHVAGTAQVAGRTAWLVVAARDDRTAARLWLDVSTGLMLREDVFDVDGRLHRMAAFIDLTVPAPAAGVRITGAGLAAAAPVAAPGWLELTPSARSGYCAGAQCPDMLPGGFRLLDLRRGSAPSGPVLHLLYGDGISAVSVFVQSGDLDQDALAGLTRRSSGGTDVWTGSGWPDRQTWQGGSLVYTVVSDAAPRTLGAALAPLPHGVRQSEGGAFASLRSGLRSVLGWLPGD